MDEANARRERDFQDQIRAHGGTGFPPELDPVEACHQGVCMKCSGIWGPLYRHIPGHYPDLSADEAQRAFHKEFSIPDDVPLIADWHRQRLSEGQMERMRGPAGSAVKAQIAETLSRLRPDLYGKTGRKPSGKAMQNWPIAKSLVRGTGDVRTAKDVGASNHKLVQRRAASLGLAFSTAFLCDHGGPFMICAMRQDSRLANSGNMQGSMSGALRERGQPIRSLTQTKREK